MTAQDEPGTDQEKRPVFLTAETTVDLLREGETTATIFEDDGDEMVRNEVKVINTAGTHPLYDTSDAESDDAVDEDTSFLRELGRDVFPVATVFAIMTGVLYLMPTATMSINGETVSIPPTGSVMVSVIAIFAFITFIVMALPYLPGKVNGGVGR